MHETKGDNSKSKITTHMVEPQLLIDYIDYMRAEATNKFVFTQNGHTHCHIQMVSLRIKNDTLWGLTRSCDVYNHTSTTSPPNPNYCQGGSSMCAHTPVGHT